MSHAASEFEGPTNIISAHSRYIGQKPALRVIRELVEDQRLKRRISDAALSFLFLGPSGVGKTELARKVAEVLHCETRLRTVGEVQRNGDHDPLHANGGSQIHGDYEAVSGTVNDVYAGASRADAHCDIKSLTKAGKFVEFKMGNYRSDEQFANWIGVPDGVKGSDGHLSDVLLKNPDAVVYLDEIEKSVSSAGDLLLAMLDNKGSVQVSKTGQHVFLFCSSRARHNSSPQGFVIGAAGPTSDVWCDCYMMSLKAMECLVSSKFKFLQVPTSKATFILSSNLASAEILEIWNRANLGSVSERVRVISEGLDDVLARSAMFSRQELRSRLAAVVPFTPFLAHEVREIATLHLENLRKRYRGAVGWGRPRLAWTPRVLDYLSDPRKNKYVAAVTRKGDLRQYVKFLEQTVSRALRHAKSCGDLGDGFAGESPPVVCAALDGGTTSHGGGQGGGSAVPRGSSPASRELGSADELRVRLPCRPLASDLEASVLDALGGGVFRTVIDVAGGLVSDLSNLVGSRSGLSISHAQNEFTLPPGAADLGRTDHFVLDVYRVREDGQLVPARDGTVLEGAGEGEHSGAEGHTVSRAETDQKRRWRDVVPTSWRWGAPDDRDTRDRVDAQGVLVAESVPMTKAQAWLFCGEQLTSTQHTRTTLDTTSVAQQRTLQYAARSHPDGMPGANAERSRTGHESSVRQEHVRDFDYEVPKEIDWEASWDTVLLQLWHRRVLRYHKLLATLALCLVYVFSGSWLLGLVAFGMAKCVVLPLYTWGVHVWDALPPAVQVVLLQAGGAVARGAAAGGQVVGTGLVWCWRNYDLSIAILIFVEVRFGVLRRLSVRLGRLCAARYRELRGEPSVARVPGVGSRSIPHGERDTKRETEVVDRVVRHVRTDTDTNLRRLLEPVVLEILASADPVVLERVSLSAQTQRRQFESVKANVVANNKAVEPESKRTDAIDSESDVSSLGCHAHPEVDPHILAAVHVGQEQQSDGRPDH